MWKNAELVMKYMMKHKPNSTLWDFIELLYTVSGNKFPVTESDEDIHEFIKDHLLGYSPKDIADRRDSSSEIVRDYLQYYGFRPWENTDTRLAYAYHDYQYNKSPELDITMRWLITGYMFRKMKEEQEHARARFTNL